MAIEDRSFEMHDAGYGMIPLRARDGSIRACTIVDADDYETLSRLRWCMNTNGYVVRSVPSTTGHRQRTEFMHRVILGLDPGDGLLGDHKNRDRLDNRRCNLRVVTAAANTQNKSSHGTSHHRGVSWSTRMGKWKAKGSVGGTHRTLGFYDDEQEAARVARDWRLANMPYAVD